MALIHEFRDDPPGFLAKYAVIVLKQDPEEFAPLKPKSFEMVKQHESSNVVVLQYRLLMPGAGNSIKAYWLPWYNKKAVTLKLGNEAAFMFTTEMTNCRFSVLSTKEGVTTVAHVAGTTGPEDRDQWEVDAGFPKRGEEGDKRVRRMSVSGHEQHGYWGQQRGGGKFEASRSAFVFGQFKNERWCFYSQVVKGNVTPDEIKIGKIPERIEGLHTIDA
jgi:hypothetical protein